MDNAEKKAIALKYEQEHIALLKTQFNYQADDLKPLRAIENSMHKIAEDYANGTISDKQYHDYEETAINEVQKLFKYVPSGFFINADPRGYALKIDDKIARDTNIYKDMGGFGILAPEFSWL